jgi:hypothetical protein
VKKKIIFCLLSIWLITSCEKDDPDPFPKVETVGSQVFSTGGVKLNGNIRNLGDHEILAYGFELRTRSGNIHLVEQPAALGAYDLEIKHDLYPNEEYNYTAFVTTNIDTYRGETLSFVSNGSATPVLLSCSPEVAHIGDVITLTGENFPENPSNIVLKFGGRSATISSVTETQITFTVPRPDVSLRSLEITSFDKTVVQNGLLGLHLPIVESTVPETAFFGETLTIIGDHFNLNENFTSVTVGGINAQLVSTNRNEIQIIIPEDVNYSNSEIIVYAQNSHVSYKDFKITVPQFVTIPNQVFTDEYFLVKVDQTYENKKRFLINEVEYLTSVVRRSNGSSTILKLFLSSC